MYSLTRILSIKELVLHHGPQMLAAMVVADLFYKFGSFALECIAFLATWYAFDFVVRLIHSMIVAMKKPL